MADAASKNRGYRAIPRQGMRKWSVVQDIDGRTVVVAEFHSYPAAMAECARLTAQDAARADAFVDDRIKIPA